MALRLTRSEHPDKATYLHSLGVALLRRFGVRTDPSDLTDIDRSISLNDEASRLVPSDHPNRATYLHSLSVALLKRFDTRSDLGDFTDLDCHIATLQDIPIPMASVNIVLFGETGVGKSSVINLIAGRQVASVSPDAEGRTLSSRRYSFPVGSRTFHIWETAGLEQQEMGAVGYMAAIKGALALIQQLAQQGGVDLLLFCMRGGITLTARKTIISYTRGFVAVRYLVITHLEHEPDLKAWWTRNRASLEMYGIKLAGHACVTGLPTHSQYPESRANVERMLRGYNGQSRYVMPANSWFIEFLRLFGLFAPPKKDLKKKDLLKVLTKHCKLNTKITQELAERLVSQA